MSRQIKDIFCNYTYSHKGEYSSFGDSWEGSIFLYDDNYFEGIVIEIKNSNLRFISGFIVDGKLIAFDKFSSDLCDTYAFYAQENDELFMKQTHNYKIYTLAEKKFIGEYAELMPENSFDNDINIINFEDKENIAPINGNLKGVLVAPNTGKPMGKCNVAIYRHGHMPYTGGIFLNKKSEFEIMKLKFRDESHLEFLINDFKKNFLESKSIFSENSKLRYTDDLSLKETKSNFDSYLYQNISQNRQENYNALVKHFKKKQN